VDDVPVVFDVLYDPWPTPLAERATAAGRRLVGGLDLLLWQAVDQVRAMTGRFDVPVAAMRAAARRDSPNAPAERRRIARVPGMDSTALAVLVGAVVGGAAA
jgi:hypothetical protein